MEARLQKVLAQRGVASRRRAEEMIRAGRVSVNGEEATIGLKVDPEQDEIRVDDELIEKRRGLGMFVREGAKNQLLSSEQQRFLQHDWPEIKARIAGDAFFPTINTDEWEVINRTHHPIDERHHYAFDFVELARKIAT